MKKLLCFAISLALIVTTSTFMVYAVNGGEKIKTASDKITDVTENSEVNLEDSTAGEDEVTKPKDAEDKGQNAAIEALKEQFMELHKDKEKRKEILKQIVELRRENNDKSTPVFVDGNIMDTDVPPVIKSGRTLIPLRAVSNSLKAKVEWDQKTNMVTISKENTVIIVTLGSNIATVNGEEVKIEVPAELISNRTMVPIRFIAEIFNKNVDWDEDTGSVVIDDEDTTVDPSAEGTQTPEPSVEVTVTPTPTAESSQEPTVTPVPSATPEPQGT